MTASHPAGLATTALHTPHRLLARVPEAALAALLFALVTGAWLAFFYFVPFDFTPPRPR